MENKLGKMKKNTCIIYWSCRRKKYFKEFQKEILINNGIKKFISQKIFIWK